MTHKAFLVPAMVLFILATVNAGAGEPDGAPEDPEWVVALSTEDFEIAETDVSHLAIGDAETIHTESGKTIDLLRTEGGLEIYVNGELLDLGLEGAHGGYQVVHTHVDIDCESDLDCEETIWMSDDDEYDLESLHSDGHHEKLIVIKEEVKTD